MGFDDLFDRGHHQRYGGGHNDHHNDHHDGHHDNHHNYNQGNYGYQNDHHNDHGYRNDYPYNQGTNFFPSHSNHSRPDMKRMIMDKLSNNPQMKSLLIIAAVVIIVVLIILAIIVVPLLFKFVSYIGDQGIKGFLDAIWKGSK
jgi:hypothetical protein